MSTCVLWRGDGLAAALPMVTRRGRLEAMANVHTPVFRAPAEDHDALLRVLEAVVGRQALELHIPAVAGDDPVLSTLVQLSAAHGRLALVERDVVSPVVDTRGDWADYRRQMKSKWGSVERKGRKMRREHDADFALVELPERLEETLQRGLAVEASGWKGDNGTAVLSAPDTAAFYRAVAQDSYAAGTLRMSTILLDGRAVAFDLGMLHKQRHWVLKTGFDEDRRLLSPGLVLRRAVIERCFALGLDAFEFAGDDAVWKWRFTAEANEHFSVRSHRFRLHRVLGNGYRRAVRAVLDRVERRSPSRRPRPRGDQTSGLVR